MPRHAPIPIRASRLVGTLIALAISCPVGFAQDGPTNVLRVIVVGSADEAEALQARIARGESFHALAVEHSTDTSASRGGNLGSVAIDDLRAAYSDALAAAVDGLSPVVEVDGAFAILQWVPPIETEWRRLRERALEATGSGRYAEADDLFERALGAAETFGPDDPRLANSLNDLAELRRLQGRDDDALPLYERAIALWNTLPSVEGPVFATSLTNLARIRTGREEFAGAERLYRRAIAIWIDALGSDHPNVAGAQSSLAQVLGAQGQYEEAARLLDGALAVWEPSLGPRDSQVIATRSNLASMLSLAGRFDAAVRIHERVLGAAWGVPGGSLTASDVVGVSEQLVTVIGRSFLGESRGPAWQAFLGQAGDAGVVEPYFLSAARLLVSVGLSAEADDLLNAAVDRFPGSRAARYERARLRADAGRIGDAIHDLAQALELPGPGPTNSDLLRILGDQHAERGELDDALAFYTRAVDVAPFDPATRIALGILRKLMAEPDRARTEFQRAVELGPESADARFLLAELELETGRFSESADAASAAVSIDPDHRQARYVLARALIQDGRRDEGRAALDAYQRVGDNSRNREARLFERTVVERDAIRKLDDGDVSGSLEILDSGIASFPDDGRLQLVRGVLLAEGGRTEAAIEAFHRMISSGVGDDSVVHRYLATLYSAVGNPESETRHRALFLERIQTELGAQSPAYLRERAGLR
jgi:tetratricopeptide (TPR) repeat protein